MTREFCIPRGVTVRSVNGPEKTWIYRDGPCKSGASGTLTLDHTFVKDYASLDPSAADCRSGDPKFRNRAKGNFRIKSTSPCFNAGTLWDGIEGATYLDGLPRLKWSRSDLDCYENPAGGGFLLRVR